MSENQPAEIVVGRRDDRPGGARWSRFAVAVAGLVVIGFAGILTSRHNSRNRLTPEAQNAIESLERVDARASTGINHNELRNALGDLELAVRKMGPDDGEGQQELETRRRIRLARDHYAFILKLSHQRIFDSSQMSTWEVFDRLTPAEIGTFFGLTEKDSCATNGKLFALAFFDVDPATGLPGANVDPETWRPRINAEQCLEALSAAVLSNASHVVAALSDEARKSR
jgi:hypothetical protein